MKIQSFLIFSMAVILLFPGGALATQIEGTVQGLNCVAHGKVCPVGKEDPVAATESVFVVLAADGGYYYVPNLDRAVLARHIAEKVRVTGRFNKKYKSITADTFEVWRDAKWQTTWSTQLMQDWIQQIPAGDVHQ